jgi:hypothetical protein
MQVSEFDSRGALSFLLSIVKQSVVGNFISWLALPPHPLQGFATKEFPKF